MDQMYLDSRLPLADGSDYKNEFEREFFQIVNLLRSKPSYFVRFVKQYSSSNLCTKPSACKIVEAKLKDLEAIGEVLLEGAASDACYVNLTKNDQISGSEEP